jgi:hypothetical protein
MNTCMRSLYRASLSYDRTICAVSDIRLPILREVAQCRVTGLLLTPEFQERLRFRSGTDIPHVSGLFLCRRRERCPSPARTRPARGHRRAEITMAVRSRNREPGVTGRLNPCSVRCQTDAASTRPVSSVSHGNNQEPCWRQPKGGQRHGRAHRRGA